MAWYGLVDNATGELKSIGTEAMFPDKDIAKVPLGQIRQDFGANMPILATQIWNTGTRTFVARPAPVIVDRITEIQNLLVANSQFVTPYNTLTVARRTSIMAGIRAVLTTVLGSHATRRQDESVNL